LKDFMCYRGSFPLKNTKGGQVILLYQDPANLITSTSTYIE
jgi:hypothetical protein